MRTPVRGAPGAHGPRPARVPYVAGRALWTAATIGRARSSLAAGSRDRATRVFADDGFRLRFAGRRGRGVALRGRPALLRFGDGTFSGYRFPGMVSRLRAA